MLVVPAAARAQQETTTTRTGATPTAPGATTMQTAPGATAPGTTTPQTTSGATAPGATTTAPGTTTARGATTTAPATTPPATTAPAAPASASASGARPTTRPGNDRAAVIMLLLVGALALLAVFLAALARWQAWEPDWVVRWRHATGEAGWRAGNAWAEFTDWLRIGR
jgi:hypothetical protein